MKYKAIIVDLDGTLCDISHRVHHVAQKPQNWDAFYADMHLDKVAPAVEWMINSAYNECRSVLFVTGRDTKYREQTKAWLRENGFYGDDEELFMRAEGDRRADDIVKRELYEQHIKDEYDVLFVLEDRTRVVEMWRSLGLTCFQVAAGDF